MSYTDLFLQRAHQHCSFHRKEVLAGTCGCFYCLRTFEGSEVERWIDRKRTGEPNTAMCPHCGLDMVLPAARDLPVEDPEFLKAMRAMWVETTYDAAEIQKAKEEGREPVPHRSPT